MCDSLQARVAHVLALCVQLACLCCTLATSDPGRCSARDVLDKLITGLSQVKDTSVAFLVSLFPA